MTDFQDNQTYARLEQLSTEELEALLHMGASANEDSSAYYDMIEEVILRREKESPTGRLSSIDASWDEFCTRYATPEDRDALNNTSAAAASASLNRSSKVRHSPGKPLRASVAAVVAILVLMIAVQASGFNIFGWWSDDVIWFNSEAPDMRKGSTTRSTQIYDTIQASVERCGITDSVVPSWYPDNYELLEANYFKNESSKYAIAEFSNQAEGWIHFRIINYQNTNQNKSAIAEKDASDVEEYIKNEQLFYIMNNLENCVATWSSGTWVASIEGTISEEELKDMIDSIGG